MKVLMLGWEFPPNVSGGLGTACFGLTRALADLGTEVRFVVPRLSGEEDQSFARVVGCDRVPVRAARGSGRRSRRGLRPALSHSESAAAWSRSLEVIGVDSPLAPYAGPADYRARLEAWRRERARGLGARDAVDALRRRIVEGDAAGARRRRLPFHGGYGPDLFTEVSRYALVAAEIATSRAGAFDVVHAHDWMTYPAGLAVARATGRPLVAHLHASEADRAGADADPRIERIESLGLNGADRAICVSRLTRDAVRASYGVASERLRVVHNGVQASEPPRPGRKPFAEPLVVFLGRVTRQKGPGYFLEAAAKVVAREPRVKFAVVGDGDLLPETVERAARLGLARHVHFTGFLDARGVQRVFSMADAYVMPSVSEPFGIAALEAVSAELPVIVSRQSGVCEVLENAMVVDYWDTDGIAARILELLGRPELRERLGTAGRAEASALGWETPAARVLDVYREVAA